jgi:hypothetical protein
VFSIILFSWLRLPVEDRVDHDTITGGRVIATRSASIFVGLIEEAIIDSADKLDRIKETSSSQNQVNRDPEPLLA